MFLLVIFALLLVFHAAVGAVEEDDADFALNYLTKFGYVSNTRSGNQDAVTGIRRFQSFFGLPLTDELDEETWAEMRKPRCGVLDLDSDGGIKKRSPLTGYNTKKWRQTSFTYFVYKGEDLPESEQHRIIAKAFKIWSDAAPKLKFTKAKYQEWKPTDADLKIS